MSRLIKSSGAAGIATLLSRFLGFARELVYAAFMGDRGVAGAFFLAFTIPNLFRRLLGEGALTAAFVPIAKETEKREGMEAVWRATNGVLWALIFVSVALITVVTVGLTFVLLWFRMQPDTELMLRLLRVMFPYLGFVCIAALFIGILNARGRFFLPAMGATMLNVVMIGSVYFLAPLFGAEKVEQVFGLAFGVLIAGIVQAAFQWPALRREGFRLQWVNPWTEPSVREVVRRMAPAVLGVAAYQINVVLTQGIAYFEAPEAVASFNYAVRLMELPQGVVGVSLGIYLLTELSSHAAAKDYPTFRSSLTEGLLQVIFINTLAMVVLLSLAEPIIRLLFERGAFTAASTERATFALICLAPGLVAFSINNVLARAFYALGDTTTPMRVSVFCLVIHLAIAMVLIPIFRQGGMGMASSVSAILNSALLLYAFKRKQPKFEIRHWIPNIAWIAGAGLGAGVLCHFLSTWMNLRWGHEGLFLRSIIVFGPMTLGIAFYVTVAWCGGLRQIHELMDVVFQRKPRNSPSSS